MPKSVIVSIVPDVLVWARNSIRLTLEDAARKINIPIEKLEQWEAGDSKPTIA